MCLIETTPVLARSEGAAGHIWVFLSQPTVGADETDVARTHSLPHT